MSSLSDYLFYFNLSELLAMTVLFAIVLATLHLEDNHFLALYKRIHYFYNYFCTFNYGCSYCDSIAVLYEQHSVKLNSLACLNVLQAVYEELLALFYLELLAFNFNNCVHFCLLYGYFP